MLAKIEKLIKDGRDFLVTTHIDPDGDAIGSVFALALALDGAGKKATVYLKDTVPYRYDFLPRPGRLVHSLPEGSWDTVFVLDCGSLFRVGNGHERLLSTGTLVNIDHHETNDLFGHVNLLDREASSTGEIIYRLLRSMKLEIGHDVAVNIYTAIFTDTGSFRYDNTGLAAFRICEEMVKAGVRPAAVAAMIYENHPKERFLILGEVLRTLRTFDNDRVVFAHITEEMFRKTGTNPEFIDGFAEYIKQMRGVEVAVLLREIGRDRYKISMRGKGDVDVAAICNAFGGGGHKKAAGCHMEGAIPEVEERLLKAFSAQRATI